MQERNRRHLRGDARNHRAQQLEIVNDIQCQDLVQLGERNWLDSQHRDDGVCKSPRTIFNATNLGLGLRRLNASSLDAAALALHPARKERNQKM